MDNNNIPNQDDKWLDELLGKSQVKETIGADPAANRSSNLIPPEDLELEKILQEHRAAAKREETFSGEPTMQMNFFDDPKPAATPRKQPAPKSAPASKAPAKKAKKEKKKDPLGIGHLFVTLIWLALIVVIGVTLGKNLWVYCADVMAFGKESQDVSITITEDDDIASIAKKLGDAELVRYPELFKLFATLTGKDEQIDVGTFTLNAHLDYNAMVNAMINYGPAREIVEIMFPEGYTCAQIFALLEENEVCTVAELEEYAANGELEEYWFLEGVTRGDKYCLEGYLFPDTYEFYKYDEPRRVIEKFLNGFDYRFTDSMKEKFEAMKTQYAEMLASHGYGEDYIEENKLTIRKVVIIASLIERETSGADESYDISSVIYNRLTNLAEYPFLNIDAALVYALGGKDELTEEDKTFDSPYNTYKYQGLVPGPIANPGRDSLDAAIKPNDTNYYFYALNPNTNKHHFTTNYTDHQNFLNSIG